jgi:type IV pilus assembly protein PilE
MRGILRRQEAGFTLIEMMIVVAVMGILAALVYPSYADYVRRGKIVDALGELATYRVRLEQHYQDNRNYGSTSTSCGVSPPSSAGSFTFSCNWGTTSSGQSFVATASGSGPMSGFVYTVDDSNAQRTTQFYSSSVSAGCWLRKKGDAC